MAVRQLTNKERRAARAAYKEFIAVAWVQDANPAKEGFEAGFAAGLDYQQARLDNQEAALGSCREAFEHVEADNARLRTAVTKLLAYVAGEVPLSEVEGIVAEMRRVVVEEQ